MACFADQNFSNHGRGDITMAKDTQMTFSEIQTEAHHLAAQLRLVTDAMKIDQSWKMYDDEEMGMPPTMAKTMEAINTALEILSDTPNAYVNREALDAFQWQVEGARGIMGTHWAKEYLNHPSNEIQF
jgi:hypothetical protein